MESGSAVETLRILQGADNCEADGVDALHVATNCSLRGMGAANADGQPEPRRPR